MTDQTISLDNFLSGDLTAVAIGAGRIALILIAAFIIARVVRRIARKLANRLAERQEARREQADTVVEEKNGGLRDRLADALPASERGQRAGQRAKTLGTVLGSVASIIIYAVAVMLCLAELGINLGPILAGAGIAGVALGFGAQSLVRDFLTGIFIVIEDQYGVGDIVDVGEASGMVEEVTLRVTRLRGLDGTMWHVPNGEIRRSGNKSQYWARVLLDVPIAYDADVVAASALIKEVADAVWHSHEGQEVIEEPEVWGVEDFGADSIAIRLVVKTLPGSQWDVARELRARLKEAMDREGFEIPFPQRTVWLHQPRAVEARTSADESRVNPAESAVRRSRPSSS